MRFDIKLYVKSMNCSTSLLQEFKRNSLNTIASKGKASDSMQSRTPVGWQPENGNLSPHGAVNTGDATPDGSSNRYNDALEARVQKRHLGRERSSYT